MSSFTKTVSETITVTDIVSVLRKLYEKLRGGVKKVVLFGGVKKSNIR